MALLYSHLSNPQLCELADASITYKMRSDEIPDAGSGLPILRLLVYSQRC